MVMKKMMMMMILEACKLPMMILELTVDILNMTC